jgi:hypothetical protein
MVLSKDSVAAKGLLRNSSVRTTERHYINVPENRAEAIKQLEAKPEGGAGGRTAVASRRPG